jgi:hypothetical protein
LKEKYIAGEKHTAMAKTLAKNTNEFQEKYIAGENTLQWRRP